MSSSRGIIDALDLAIAATTAIQEMSQSLSDIRNKLEQVQSEGRDLTWDEVNDARQRLHDAIERGRQQT